MNIALGLIDACVVVLCLYILQIGIPATVSEFKTRHEDRYKSAIAAVAVVWVVVRLATPHIQALAGLIVSVFA